MKRLNGLLLFSLLLAAPLSAQEITKDRLPAPGSWKWLPPGPTGSGALKEALLIGVGHHGSLSTARRGWDLPCVAEDLQHMRAALAQYAAFRSFKELEDASATLSNIKGYLTQELPARLSGARNLLLIYYSGHGVVQDGERAWFTYYTDLSGGRFTELLTSSLLSEWIDTLEAKARERGAGLRVALVMDACASEEKAPSGPARDLKLGDELLCATATGRRTSASTFTNALIESMKTLSDRDRLFLREIYEGARRRLTRASLPPPVRFPGSASTITLFDKHDFSIRVEARDKLTPDQWVRGARVLVSGKEAGRTPCALKGLSAGSYPLLVSAEGYLNLQAVVEVDAGRDGSTLAVELVPAYRVLEGRLSPENAGPLPQGLTVAVLGDLSRFRRGLHTKEAAVDPDGRFQLLIPPDSEVDGIQVRGLATPLSPVTVDLETLKPWYLTLEGRNRIPVYTLTPIRLHTSARAAVPDSKLKLGRDGRTILKEALDLAKGGRPEDLELAAGQLMDLHAAAEDEGTRKALAEKARDLLARAFRVYLSEERYHEGRLLAEEALREFSGDPEYRDWKVRFEREDIPAELRRAFDAAGKSLEAGDLARAEKLFSDLQAQSTRLTPYYRDRVSESLSAIRGDLFVEYYCRMSTCWKNNDKEGAARAFVLAAPLVPLPRKRTMARWEKVLLPYLDKEPPVITLASPAASVITVQKPRFTLSGTVRDDVGLQAVTVNGRPLSLESGKENFYPFSLEVVLEEGKNRFLVEAKDRAGHAARKEVFIKYSTVPEVPGFTYLREETFSCGGQTNTVKIYRHEKTGLEFVLVPGGRFQMGSPEDEPGRYDNEGPRHWVTIKPFLICRTECTQAAWDKIGGSDDRHWNLPIEEVSWNDATAWCRKAGLRLPSEAEWEYACRAGTTTRFCFGDSDSDLGAYAWYYDNSGKQTHPVGQKRPNAFGLFDMHGNVWEWCEDWYHKSYSGAPGDGSAWTNPSSSYRVSRGGCWIDVAWFCRSACRNRGDPGDRNDDLGFRPACSVPSGD